jgi:hypothetical protein
MRARIAVPLAVLVLVAIAVGGIALAGSGDDDPATNPAPSDAVEAPTETATPPGGLSPEFVECMADQGVTIESPEDFHKPGAQQAFPACVQFLHAGGAP